jgi:hypothetical protein
MKLRSIARVLYLGLVLLVMMQLWQAAKLEMTGRSHNAVVPYRARNFSSLKQVYAISATVTAPTLLTNSHGLTFTCQLLSGGSVRLGDEMRGQVALIVNVASH